MSRSGLIVGNMMSNQDWDPIVQDIESTLRLWFRNFEIEKKEKRVQITVYRDDGLSSFNIDLAHYAPRDIRNKAAINHCMAMAKKFAEKGIYPITKEKFDSLLKSQFSWIERCYRNGMPRAALFNTIAAELFLHPPKETNSIKTIRYQFLHFKIFGHLDLKVEPTAVV